MKRELARELARVQWVIETCSAGLLFSLPLKGIKVVFTLLIQTNDDIVYLLLASTAIGHAFKD